ncbi:alpha/beta hydrolase [Mycolicibacterium agri]|nr:alpha/beta hydrolase [Mycolicibacterium agri]
MAELPPYSESLDVATSFGTVRAYRFDGPSDGPPVVLLPGRNASTSMWRTNIPPLLARRTLIGLDLLGEAGMSVQDKPIGDAAEEAQWLDETLAGLGLVRVHLLGVSIGGWTAANAAIHKPARIASVALLDPVMTFAPAPPKAVAASLALFLPVPQPLRRRVLSWISGGADADDSLPEAQLISAAAKSFVIDKAMPKVFTDDQLRSLQRPTLALIAVRSVMLDAARALARARRLLPQGQVELWPDASHAINGEYPDEIAARAHRFWDDVDMKVTT